MANKHLPLQDIFAACDLNGKEIWKELDSGQRKEVNFWILNRWMSVVNGGRETQELAVLKTNEFYNKHLPDISASLDKGHPELLWQLLCLSGNHGGIKRHGWIGHKKKTDKGVNAKAVTLLEKLYPTMKADEIELLARIKTNKELKELAEEHGIEGFKGK